MGLCYLAPDRVKLTVNSKKETTAGSKWPKSQNEPRVKMGFCYLPPERVEIGCCCLSPDRVKLRGGLCYLPLDRVNLAVNSKKETNSRVKVGKEPK